VKSWKKFCLVSPAVIGSVLITSTTIRASANPIPAEQQLGRESQEELTSVQTLEQNNSLAQVTSVSQLSDVQPTDWAFQALQSLVERYGCIAGYPDGTYRGNRALTRYEFAAGLNACLDRVNELISTATTDLVTKEDLATLQKLQEEFGTELATIRGRVDNLEAATAELEANQFSTTTKLSGEVVVGVASLFSGDNVDGDEANRSTILGDRARLEFNTSFSGKDLLLTRLSAGNFVGFSSVTGTPEGEFSFTQDDNNNIGLEVAEYSFPVGESTTVFLAATGGAFDDFTDTLNVLDGDGGEGALSAFATRNPIYYLGDGAGLGIRHQLGKNFELSAGYLAGDANDPSGGNGLFNGPYAALGQLTFKPSDRLSFGLTYVHGYNTDNTGTGSSRGTFTQFDDTFFADNPAIANFDAPTTTNAYAAGLSWKVTDKIVLGGWAGYTRTSLLSTVNGLFDRGSLESWNYAVTLAFPDLGKEGNLLGFVFGMEPKVTNSSVGSSNPTIDAQLGEDNDNSFHIEGFYQYKLTDNIAVTPGIIWITSPGFNNDNSDLIVGTIRTTFSF